MTEPTQNVAPTEAAAPPAAEASSAQDNTSSLEALLGEYDAAVTPPPAPAAAATQPPPPEWQQVKSEIDAFRAERAAERERNDYANVIKEVKGDLDVPDYVVRGWLSHTADQNPRASEIWNNRDRNPQAAKKLIASLKSDFQKENRKSVDPAATADTAAVAAALKGTSTKAPEEKAPDYGAMDNASFQKELAKFGIS